MRFLPHCIHFASFLHFNKVNIMSVSPIALYASFLIARNADEGTRKEDFDELNLLE